MHKNICVQFFEPRAVSFAIEVFNQATSLHNHNVTFVVPWQETAALLRRRLPAEARTRVLTDPAIDIFDSPKSRAPLDASEQRELTRIESTYIREGGIWQVIYEDRHLLYSNLGPFIVSPHRKHERNTAIRMCLSRFLSVEEFLRDNKITDLYYLTQDYGTPLATVLFYVARQLKLNVRIPLLSRLGDHVYVADDIVAAPRRLTERYVALLQSAPDHCSAAAAIIRNVRNGDFKNYYNNSSYKAPNLRQKAILSIRDTYRQLRYRKGRYVDGHIARLAGLALMKLRRTLVRKLISYSTLSDIKKIRYVYFPLHVEPELNLLILAPHHTSQLLVIRNLARALPGDTVLVVKEHPLTVGSFPTSFYKAISRLPNVKLLSAGVAQAEIIRHAALVAVISGTAGLEALLFGKSAITFGNPYFNICRSVHRILSADDLPRVIAQILDQPPDEKDVLAFIQAVIDSSSRFDLLAAARLEMAPGSVQARTLAAKYLLMMDESTGSPATEQQYLQSTSLVGSL